MDDGRVGVDMEGDADADGNDDDDEDGTTVTETDIDTEGDTNGSRLPCRFVEGSGVRVGSVDPSASGGGDSSVGMNTCSGEAVAKSTPRSLSHGMSGAILTLIPGKPGLAHPADAEMIATRTGVPSLVNCVTGPPESPLQASQTPSGKPAQTCRRESKTPRLAEPAYAEAQRA